MGSSPSADVYYGYNLGEMVDPETWESIMPDWFHEDEGWEDELARRLGWVEAPFPDDYPDTREHWKLPYEEAKRIRDEYEQSSTVYQAYAAARDQRHALLAQVPVKLDNYGCDGGDATWALQVKASVQYVSDWESTPLNPLTVDPEWAAQIARFCELLELTVPDGGPAWHLNCSYG